MNYLTFFLENLAFFLEDPANLREYLGSFLSYRFLPILLNMSLTGALVILFVLFIRHYLLKKAPKIFSYALWAVVLFRLLCPVSFSVGFSLMGFLDPPALRSESGGASVVEYIPSDIVHTEYPRVELPLMPVLSDTINETLPYGEEQLGADPLEAPMAGLTLLVWPAGVFALLLYSAVSYFKLRRKLVGAALLRDNIWLADHIGSPFVMGLFRPKIYLPSSLAEWERDYIILHEQHHIRRGDHIIKILSFFTLCIHWFNPLVWVAFVLSGKDMEMSCDEAVIRKLGPDIRADYSRSLLSLATGRPIFSGTPLAFGEGDTGSRIKNLAGWKKAKPFAIAVSLILVVAVVIFCGANAAGSSWMKVTFGNGPSYDIALSLEEPIQSWAIYEDIYHEDELLSHTLRVSRSIPDYSGSAERRFTASLKLKDDNMISSTVSCSFSGPGDSEWQVALPAPKYGPGLTHWALYDGSGRSTYNAKVPLLGWYYVHFREPLEDDGSIILSTTTFAPDYTKDYGGVVIQYRLVTSTAPNPPQENSSSDSPAPANSSQPVPEDTLSALLAAICSSPAHSSNPGDYIAAHPEEYQQLVDGGADTLRHFFSRFLEGGEIGLEGHIMWAACEDIMRGLGEAFILDTVAMTGQDRFDRFHANARELARQYSSAELEQMYPGSFILLEMTGNAGADSEHTEHQVITAEFAPEHFLHTGNYHEFIADDSEYMTRLVFRPGEVLRNVSFYSLQYELGTYVVSEELYTLSTLSPDKPLVTGVVFYGSMTTYGISFTDADGYARHFAVYTSGMDGSLILQEYLPYSEFALFHSPSSQRLGLWRQSGSFPWGTDLKEAEHKFWSGDGFDCFSFTCTDGTVLTGLRAKGVSNEQNGTLLTIEATNSDWQTPRGAFVGMGLDDFLVLYPDAEQRGGPLDPGDYCYTYVEENAIGFLQLLFTFDEDILTSISVGNGIDGYLW